MSKDSEGFFNSLFINDTDRKKMAKKLPMVVSSSIGGYREISRSVRIPDTGSGITISTIFSYRRCKAEHN